MVKIESAPVFSPDNPNTQLRISATIDSDLMRDRMASMVVREVCQLIAERYVTEHYQEIAALLSQDAIATLSVAESAAKIRETLEKKIPDRVMEIVKTKTEVYQRGILGGLKRIL